MLLNKTERLQIKFHRNDRWQDHAEGGFASVSNVGLRRQRRNGKILRGHRVISEEDRSRIETLKRVLEPK